MEAALTGEPGVEAITAALLAADAILLKAAGLPTEATFRNLERRLFDQLARTFITRAKRAVSKATAGMTGDGPATAADAKRAQAACAAAFRGWDADMAPVVTAVVKDAYRTGKDQLWQRRRGVIGPLKPDAERTVLKGPKKPKAAPTVELEVKPTFGLKDEKAMKAIAKGQIHWIGEHYDKNLSTRVASVSNELMLERGLGRKEAGAQLAEALQREFDLKSDPLSRGGGISVPSGWTGRSDQYFEGLAANTVTTARNQGGMRAMREVGVTKYVISNPLDERTCARCQYLDGKTFTVATAAERMDKINAATSPDKVKELHPWATSVAQLKGSKNLEADGYSFPPFHFICRCVTDIVESDDDVLPADLAPEPTAEVKDTKERFYKEGKWAPERAVMHDAYAKAVTRGLAKTEAPTVYMTGGGPASGKSSGLLENPAAGIPNKKHAAHIDPDGAKAVIPEYKAAVKAGDLGAAGNVHEESSHMSKRAVVRAIDKGHDVVYDSTGDSGIDKLQRKVDEMRAAGAKRIVANYATIDVDEAIRRADLRAAETGRHVDHDVIRATHADVANTSLEAINKGTFDEFTLWDTTGAKPLKVATFDHETGLVVHDKGAWKAHTSRSSGVKVPKPK